jgi:hypothetical protein
VNDADEARLDWDEDGPDESDVLADNERLDAEVKRLGRKLANVRGVITNGGYVDNGGVHWIAVEVIRRALGDAS